MREDTLDRAWDWNDSATSFSLSRGKAWMQIALTDSRMGSSDITREPVRSSVSHGPRGRIDPERTRVADMLDEAGSREIDGKSMCLRPCPTWMFDLEQPAFAIAPMIEDDRVGHEAFRRLEGEDESERGPRPTGRRIRASRAVLACRLSSRTGTPSRPGQRAKGYPPDILAGYTDRRRSHRPGRA